MAIYKSGNPALSKDIFKKKSLRLDESIKDIDQANVMTLQGTINKTGILMLGVFAAAFYTWNLFSVSYSFQAIAPFFYGGLIGGVLLAIIISFKIAWAQYLAPFYAVSQGFALGGLSALAEYAMPGIVIQALLLTFGIFAVILIIYKLKIVKPTENTKMIIISATAGLLLSYVFIFLLSLFGIHFPFLHDNSISGIIFSVFAIILAALTLVVDFDFIEQGEKYQVPKYMEWYAAFGLMVTIIWLYIELLRLLGKAKK